MMKSPKTAIIPPKWIVENAKNFVSQKFISNDTCLYTLFSEPPQASKNCPRANGFFAWPSEESCQKFWDCRGGTSYLQICPEGVIFDMTVDSCVTPDQSKREECQAEKFLKYDCPNYSSEE